METDLVSKLGFPLGNQHLNSKSNYPRVSPTFFLILFFVYALSLLAIRILPKLSLNVMLLGKTLPLNPVFRGAFLYPAFPFRPRSKYCICLYSSMLLLLLLLLSHFSRVRLCATP